MEPEIMKNVKWLDYGKNMLDIQKSIFLSSSMFDVIIAVGEIRFKAHQLILTACSDFFLNILMDYPKHLVATIIIPNLNQKLIEPILVFMYTGQVYVSSSMLSDFMDACSFLKIKGFITSDCLLNGFKIQEKTTDTIGNRLDQINESYRNIVSSLEDDSTEIIGDPNEEYQLYEDEIQIRQSDEMDQIIEHTEIESQPNNDDFVEVHVLEPEESVKEMNDNDVMTFTLIDENFKVEVVESNNKELPNMEEYLEAMNEEEISASDLTNSELQFDTKFSVKYGKTYTEEELIKALEETKVSKNVQEVAEKYNIPRSTIYMKLRQNEEYRSLYRSFRTNSIDAAVNAVTKNRLSLKEASTKYNVAKTVLWRKLKQNSLYKPEERINVCRGAAMEAIKKGETLISISKKFNIPLSTLHRDKVRLFSEGKLPKHCKLKRRDKDPGFKERLRTAVLCCENGLSQKMASELHNVPKTTIWRHLKQHYKNSDKMVDQPSEPENSTIIQYDTEEIIT